MSKLVTASLLLFVLIVLQTNAFAGTLNCKFKTQTLKGVESVQLTEDTLLLNKEMEIPLEKSRLKCGHASRQVRLDGRALGYQVILKSCMAGEMGGHIIDSVNAVAAEVTCE